MAAVPSIGRASLVEAPRVAPHAAATEGLYERHAAKIQSYCHHQLGSREEAEDAVQTTFMNAFRALGRGVVPEAESAWLFKIAENVCLSRRRSSWRRGRIESPSDFGLIEEVIPGPNRQRDELIGIEDALASMPEQQRRAILLREWQGLSYREVAEELEISQSAVETLIFRARRTLAQGLEEPERTKPKRKSFRRALHALDFGTLVAAAKTLLAGSAAVKATAAAVAVTAAAGTVATVAPKIEPRSHHLASAPKHVSPAPSTPEAAAAAAPAFVPAGIHAGEPASQPAPAAPKRAQPAKAAAPTASTHTSVPQQQPTAARGRTARRGGAGRAAARRGRAGRSREDQRGHQRRAAPRGCRLARRAGSAARAGADGEHGRRQPRHHHPGARGRCSSDEPAACPRFGIHLRPAAHVSHSGTGSGARTGSGGEPAAAVGDARTAEPPPGQLAPGAALH